MAGPGTILLASTSPRRSALLREAGIPFHCIPPGEEPEGNEGPPLELALERATAKALGAHAQLGGGEDHGPDALILGVDTVVESAGVALGKPRDEGDAEAMLRGLAAAGPHRVHSAHCLVRPGDGTRLCEASTAVVTFAGDPDLWLPGWLGSGLWRGKAGGYGIQDEAAGFVELVAGGRDTVIGLCVPVVLDMCARLLEAGHET